MLTVFLAIICTILMLAGLAGIVLPFIPAVLVAWLGLFIFAIGTGFERISIAATVIFFVVMLLTFAFDFFGPMIFARKNQASNWGVLGGFLGSFIGIGTMGAKGVFIGQLLGTLLLELITGRKPARALKITFGTLIGIVASTSLKILVILIMLGFLIASWF